MLARGKAPQAGPGVVALAHCVGPAQAWGAADCTTCSASGAAGLWRDQQRLLSAKSDPSLQHNWYVQGASWQVCLEHGPGYLSA